MYVTAILNGDEIKNRDVITSIPMTQMSPFIQMSPHMDQIMMDFIARQIHHG
jgi:hypothetical protein